MEPMVKPRALRVPPTPPNLLRTQPVNPCRNANAWRIQRAKPCDAGWASRATDITLRPGMNGIVGSVRSGGASVAVYAFRPAGDVAWGLARLTLFAVAGPVRVPLAGPVPIPVGGAQVVNLPNGAGGLDSLELELTFAPPITPIAAVPNLRVALVTWDGGSAFWDARFVELLDRLQALAVLCGEKKG